MQKLLSAKKFILFIGLILFLSGCHRRIIPETTLGGSGKLRTEIGYASYYSDKFNGRSTSSGEPFSNSKYTAAHKKLPFGTKVKVTNLANGKFVIVRINDRGPFVVGRIIDLSKAAAYTLGMLNEGTAKVSITYRE